MSEAATHDGHNDHHPSGIMRWLTTTNHKDIGTMYLVFSLVMFFIGGAMAMVIRAELFQPGLQFVDPQFFNSSLGVVERHNRLGRNKKQSYEVNKKKFISFFSKFMKQASKKKIFILENLHYAYLEARGDRKAKKKILLINTHVLSFTKNFLSIFENKKPSIIYTTRHPLSALSSQILNNLTYEYIVPTRKVLCNITSFSKYLWIWRDRVACWFGIAVRV